MNRFELKKLYHQNPELVKIEVTPRRWRYLVKIIHDDHVNTLTSWWTKKPLYFDNLAPINKLMKQLKIKTFELAHNCPHTEVSGLDNNQKVQPQRKDTIKMAV